MFLRSLRSINKLSARFNNNPKNHSALESNIYLILIFLAPAEHSAEITLYHTTLALIAEALLSQNGVQSVRKLRAIVPYGGITPTNLTSTTCANALLVRIEGSNNLKAQVKNITDVVKHHEYYGAGDRSERIFHWSITAYAQIQIFSPKRSKEVSGTCIVTVSITPASKPQASDAEAWYRREQLPLLSAHAPQLYLRSWRYDSLPSSSVREGDLMGEGVKATVLAVHEYVSVEALLQYSLEHGPVLGETEWSRRVLGEAERVERGVWEVV